MVSIIVPNYNHAKYLKERIDSIFSQTYQDYELILLDDKSTDDSRYVLEGYRNNPRVSHIIYNDINSTSPFIQWRKGISLAKGEWIWIAESDDVANEYFLDTLMKVTDNKNIGLVYSHLQWIDSDGNFMCSQDNEDEYEYFTGKRFIEDKLLYTTTIFNVSSAIFRKEVLEQVDWSKFSKMKMCGDYYLYVLLSSLCDVCECKKVLDSYRQHNNNTSGELTKKGWSLIEGMPILKEIVTKYKIKSNRYSSYYAKMWAKYDFDLKIDVNVAKSFIEYRFYLVFILFIAYKTKRIINRVLR